MIRGRVDARTHKTKIKAVVGAKKTKAIHETTAVVFARAWDTVPTDTHRLQNSHRMVTGPDWGEVSANTEYALYVHDGTSRMGPRPWLDEALAWGVRRLPMIVRRIAREP